MDYYPYYHGYHAYNETNSGSWAGYIALFLVIIVIIALIIFFVMARNGGTPVLTPKWTVTTITDGANIVGTGGTYYLVSGTITSAVLKAPPDPVGQEFIIDNSKSSSDLLLSVAGNTKTIPAGTVATFVWITSSDVSAV